MSGYSNMTIDQSEKAICDSTALYISYFDKYLDNKVVRCKCILKNDGFPR